MLINEIVKELNQVQELLENEGFASRESCFLIGQAQAYKNVYAIITGRKFDYDYELDTKTNQYKHIQ